MAIISKTQMPYVNGIFNLVIKCDSKGTFSTVLPPEVMSDLLLGDKIESGSLRDLEDLVTTYLQKFCDQKKEIKKVIAYDITLNGQRRVLEDGRVFPKNLGSSSSDLSLGNPWSFDDDVFISMNVGVFDETTLTRDKGDTTYYYEVVESSIPEFYSSFKPYNSYGDKARNVIDWTQDREDFFANFCKSFDVLLFGLWKFFKNPEFAVQCIDSGVRIALPEPKENVNETVTD